MRGEKEMVREWMASWLSENTDLTADGIVGREDENLFSAGILDSMRFMFLVAAAEERFGIHFSQEDFEFSSNRYSSFSGFCSIIEGHLP